ncbi:MAG: InlB B-repeat-containing protein [Faecalicoccus sp.]|nr:InlB B-repeat-containing protein [Faecalicoccus sp.]MDY5234090.1 InlB B-repeat-containing protein [Faecalicoccus sp.]
MLKHVRRGAALILSMAMFIQLGIGNNYITFASEESQTPEQTQEESGTTTPETTGEVPEESSDDSIGTQESTEPTPETGNNEGTVPDNVAASTLVVQFVNEDKTNIDVNQYPDREIALTGLYVNNPYQLEFNDHQINTEIEGYTLSKIVDANDAQKEYPLTTMEQGYVDITLSQNITKLQLVYTKNPEPVQQPDNSQTETDNQQSSEEQEESSEEDGQQDEQIKEDTETVKEETESEEVSMPEQVLSAVASDGATITIMAPEGSVPENSTVVAEPVENDSVAQSIEDALNEEDKTLNEYKAYDITILDKDGNEIQPEKDVQVSITGVTVSGEEKAVFHIDDSNKVEKVSDTSVGQTTLFNAESFSIYVVAGLNEGISERTISTSTKEIRVGETIRLTTDQDSSRYDHKWTISDASAPINNRVVSLSNESRNGVTVTGKTEGVVTVTHEWGRNFFGWRKEGSETITIRVSGVVEGNNQSYTVYVYSLIPGKDIDSGEAPDLIWNGMGKETVTGVLSPDSYANASIIPSGTYTYTPPATYPNIEVNGKTYTYDQEGTTINTYSIEIIRLVTAGGANPGNNGYNDSVEENIPTFHLDTRIVLHDEERMQVGFHIKAPGIKAPGQNEFVVDEETNRYYDVGTSESDITKPEVEENVTLADGTQWKFDGWYKNEDCTIPANFDGTLTQNQDYYGKYVQVGEYKVQYNDRNELYNFGDGTENPEIVNINDGYVVKGSDAIHDQSNKHILVGWITEDGLKEFGFGNGNIVINKKALYDQVLESSHFRAFGETYKDNVKNGETINLYAIWALESIVQAKITVVYHGNGNTGGSAPTDNQTYYADQIVTLKGKADLEKTGYTFKGWSLLENGEVIDGNTIDLSKIQSIQEGAQILNLYAQWTPAEGTAYKVEHYKVNAEGTSATLFDTENLTGTTEQSVSATPQTINGYTYKADFDQNGMKTVASGMIVGDGSLVLKLYYTPNDDQLKYDANGGEGTMEPTEGKVDQEVTVAENTFTRKGYNVAGWKTADGTNYDEGSTYKLTANDDILCAQWTRDLSTVTVTPYEGAYDGKGHNVTVNGAIDGDQVEYSIDGTNYTDNLSFVDVTDGEQKVYIRVTNGDQSTVAESYVLITPAPVTVKSGSAKKVYDGTSLTNTKDTTITGLVNGEKVTLTTTVTITNVGSVSNTVTVDWGNVKETNYTVDYNLGTLTVTAQSIDPSDPSYLNVKANKPENKVYDGKDHKWIPEVTLEDGTPLVEGTDYTVTYSTENFKDVQKIKVTIEGTGNYSGTVTRKYRITRKPITVTTDSAIKVYDGSALTADGRVEGIVDGETYGFVITGAQTEVGSSENTYKIEWTGSAKEGNYKIDEDLGTLTVVPQSIDPEDPTKPEDPDQPVYAGITVNKPENKVYDGQEHKWTPTVTLSDGTVLDPENYEVSYDTEDFVNVTGKITVTITGTGNYAGTVTREYQITPRAITITSADDTKVYDGTPLTNGNVSVTQGSLVSEEDITFKATGSQTEVGSSANTIEVTYANEQMEKNYEVILDEGTLTVTEKPAGSDSDEDSESTDGEDTATSTNVGIFASLATSALAGLGILAALKKRRKD